MKNIVCGVFLAIAFDTEDLMCFYYGTLVYQNLIAARGTKQLHGDFGIMGVNKSRFMHNAMHIGTAGHQFNEVTSFTDGERCVYIVPALFCVLTYINDGSYSSRDVEHDPAKFPVRRQNNVELFQQPSPARRVSDLVDPTLITVRAIRTIHRGDELYFSYSLDNFDMARSIGHK